ncbi:MAG: type VI secretion system contractile sheath domain-containing protein [Paracoccaceae bacterium]
MAEVQEPPANANLTLSSDAEFSFGTVGEARPEPGRLQRKRFRIALMGDFSGRSARGQLEIGDELKNRRATVLDPDTIDDVIAGFATTLILPIGRDGAGIEVKLENLDDLHPDELYEKVEIFSALASLKGQLGAGATAQSAQAELLKWGAEFGNLVAPPRSRSFGNSVPADRRLSDFQKLIGDTANRLTKASPLDELLAQIVGPHISAAPTADSVAMQDAVDQALSSAMRLVLHHPEFQAVESQWRSLDLIASQIEANDSLDVVLYDISAEEIAADLAAVENISDSGLMRLLGDEPLDAQSGCSGYSALIGLYTFEETPPHAELLGRIGRIAAHIDAPFFTAISPAFMDIDKADRHRLVADAWDTLRSMPEARHLGIASPRFLLRRPYGAKSEPIYEFPFEEFTMQAGLGGMLWANPAVLITILLAQSFQLNGPGMLLGSVMSLGEMPYHYVKDQYGDQVALPCTERNLTTSKVETVVIRGFMPVISIKGRDLIRLGSFQSLAGGEILGPWSGVAPPPPSPPAPVTGAKPEQVVDESGLKSGSIQDESAEDDINLDDLLAAYDDDNDDNQVANDGNDTDDGEIDIDAELAALLENL